MNKNKLINYIKKYYLNGKCASAGSKSSPVKLQINDKVLSVGCVSSANDCVINLKMKDFDLQDTQLGIYDTGDFLKIINAMDDDITISIPQEDGQNAHSLTISDKNAKAEYICCDEQLIQKTPQLKNDPEYDIVCDITKEFTQNFIRYFNALSQIDTFAITQKDDKIKLTLNYSTVNVNNIVLDMPENKNEGVKFSETLCFPAGYLKEILTVNDDESLKGSMYISKNGLMKIVYSNDIYDIKYYLIYRVV